MKSKTASISIALIAACLLVSGVAMAGKNPATYTCSELLEVDVDYVPQVVYWLDGYNWAGDPMLEEDVEWVPVATDDILVDCKKDPSQKAADVVKKHSKSKK